MHHTRTPWNLVIALCALALAAVGCDQSTGTDAANDVSSRTQTINLDDPYGGFNTSNEAAAFGDASLATDFGPDFAGIADDDVDTTRTDPRRPKRFLMVTWGNLRADSLIDFPTDWSGSLCVENGVVSVLRTIRFEPRDTLLPRTSPACVEWVSHTMPSFDGILVALHHERCDSTLDSAGFDEDRPCIEPISVTFTTGPLTVTFTQEELADLHKVIVVDDAGNAVAFNTIVMMPGECPHGFLAGEWKDVEAERYKGIFRGQWVSENGEHHGFVRGVYGPNGRGEPVFFGKWISAGGEFRGLLRGRYGLLPPTNDSEADGWFAGVYLNRYLREVGGLRGVWGEGTGEDEGGFFRGAWAARCPK
jgi:hypothetical protein